jgi:hypothetical protein
MVGVSNHQWRSAWRRVDADPRTIRYTLDIGHVEVGKVRGRQHIGSARHSNF